MLKAMITTPCHACLQERLEQAGYEVIYNPAITYDQLKALMPQLQGLVVSTRLPIDKELLQQGRGLQWIGRLGSGLELIDVAFAKDCGIKVFSSPEGNRDAVGEHALGMLLALLHKLVLSAAEVKQGQWLRDVNRGTELGGKTVGIIGYGNTGEAFARKLSGFDVSILAYDKYRFGFGGSVVKEASLEQVLKYSDVVSLHLPLTNETRHLANDVFFDQCERKPWFINTSRGGVHDTAAVVRALERQQIAGAALDVLENERLNSYSHAEQAQLQWLLQQSNVLITPHIAGYSHESFFKMSKVLVEKLGI